MANTPRYEIHSAVFLYKAHLSGAMSSGKYAQTSSLVRRFIALLEAAATDKSHIACNYAKLLNGLYFSRTTTRASGRPNGISDVEASFHDNEVADPLATLASEAGMNQMSFFDGMGLQPFDCTDPADGLFSIPTAFPWDQSFS